MNDCFNYDIVFCQLPPMSLQRIYSAPPILKGIVQSLGYRSCCFDFNLKLFDLCDRDPKSFAAISNYFIIENSALVEKERNILKRYLTYIVDTLLKVNARYIGLSVFSDFTHSATALLLQYLQTAGLKDRVLLGGRGLTAVPFGNSKTILCLSVEEQSIPFYQLIQQRNLASHVVLGDGEDAIVEFLKQGQIDIARHEVKQLTMHWPDYTDYNFDQYLWINGVPSLDITGSTGCVRNCDFCTVPNQFGRYRFLPGQELAQQMIHFQQTYGINKFNLTDSLANGGLKHFRAFMQCLADHNATAAVPIAWSGQYICRDMSSHLDVDNYYRLIKLSGGEGLTIGAESGSNNVLEAMDKKSSVEALFFELEKFRQHGITCLILTFCGHWSERHEDFVEHCKMLVRLTPYIRSQTISGLSLGSLFALTPEMPAAQNINNVLGPGNPDMWISRINRSNTYKVRAQRRLILSKLAYALDCSVLWGETQMLNRIISNIQQNCSEFDQFFLKYKSDDSQFVPIADADDFVQQMLTYKDTLTVKLSIDAHECNGLPEVVIKINDTVLWNTTIDAGRSDLNFEININDLKAANNVLSIAMTNKGHNDTEVDNNGCIVKDKNIVFLRLSVDNCDLFNDVEFFYSYLKSPGLWSNDPMIIVFDSPFVQWYSKKSNKNKTNSLVELHENETQGSYFIEDAWHLLSTGIKTLKI